MIRSLAVLFFGGLLSAQVPIGGPVEGYVFDKPTRTFRAVLGSLGGASLGGALADGFDFGWVAARHSHGLGWREGKLYAIAGLGSETKVSELGESAAPESVAWSEDGAVAVVYGRGSLVLVRGLPGAATVSTVAAPEGFVAAAAGKTIVVAAAGGVYRLDDGVRLAEVRAVALSFSGNLLYVLEAGRVTAIDVETLAVDGWEIAGAGEVTAIRAEKDLVYVAGKEAVVAYDARTRQAVTRLELGFTPNAFEPLGAGSYLLSARTTADSPFWTMTNSPEPAIRFIPATPLAAGEVSGR